MTGRRMPAPTAGTPDFDDARRWNELLNTRAWNSMTCYWGGQSKYSGYSQSENAHLSVFLRTSGFQFQPRTKQRPRPLPLVGFAAFVKSGAS
jgi:hypothetical protein